MDSPTKSGLAISPLKMMKALTLMIAVIILLNFSSFGQYVDTDREHDSIQTIFGLRNSSNGGYGGFGAAYSSINGEPAFVTSARGAWIINHKLAIGFAGAGFINDFHYNTLLESDVNLTGGYGGLLVEQILFPLKPVHITIPIIAGVGGVAYTSNFFERASHNRWEGYVEDTEVFLIAEPGLELEFNVIRFFRFSFAASYRFTSKLRLLDTPGDALQGFSVGFNIKFGKF